MAGQSFTMTEATLMEKLRKAQEENSWLRGRLIDAAIAINCLIGDERGICRCCGRAHAIQHDDDCPVPRLLSLVAPIGDP